MQAEVDVDVTEALAHSRGAKPWPSASVELNRTLTQSYWQWSKSGTNKITAIMLSSHLQTHVHTSPVRQNSCPFWVPMHSSAIDTVPSVRTTEAEHTCPCQYAVCKFKCFRAHLCCDNTAQADQLPAKCFVHNCVVCRFIALNIVYRPQHRTEVFWHWSFTADVLTQMNFDEMLRLLKVWASNA